MVHTCRLTTVDIFSGAGGLSEGFRQAGFEVMLGVDCDRNSVRTFRRHHGKAIESRIEDLTVDMIRSEIDDREITVLTAGPPCQAFSTAAVGKLKSLHQSTTIRNPLNMMYKEVLRIIKQVKPSFFVMENVGRMFSISNGRIKSEIESELNGTYDVSFYKENVADFGVPQIRKRGLAIGNNMGLDNPRLIPTHHDPEKGKRTGMKKYETVRSAILDLPRIKIGGGAEVMPYPKRKLTSYQVQRRKRTDRVHNHTARIHNERDMRIFKMLKPGKQISDLPEHLNPYRSDIFKDKIKRQPLNKPSSTILAHLSKDGLMFVHPTQHRSLTPREAARLQSFDDDYVFEGPRTSQFTQIGNAVPPLFARHVARSIMNAIASGAGSSCCTCASKERDRNGGA